MHHPIRIRALRLGLAACLLAGALAGLASAARPLMKRRFCSPMTPTTTSSPCRMRRAGIRRPYPPGHLIQQERAAHPDALVLDAGDFPWAVCSRPSTPRRPRSCGPWVRWGTTPRRWATMSLTTAPAAWRRCSTPPWRAAIRCPHCPGQLQAPEEDADTWAAWDRYGIGDHLILERGGVRGIFGLMGGGGQQRPHVGQAWSLSRLPMRRSVPWPPWRRREPTLSSACPTAAPTAGKGEDYELAKRVDGIDVILSGHTTTLDEPLRVGTHPDCVLREYTANLGVLTVEWKPNGGKNRHRLIAPRG